MKKIRIFVFCLIAFSLACSHLSEPEKYYNHIMKMQNRIVDDLFEMNRYCEYLDSTGLNKVYHNTLIRTGEYTEALEETGPLAGDSLLQNAALDLFRVYLAVLEDEMLRMKQIVNKPGELSTSDDDKLLKLRKSMFGKLSEAEKKFAGAQYKFNRMYMPGKVLTEPDSTLFEEEADTVSGALQ